MYAIFAGEQLDADVGIMATRMTQMTRINADFTLVEYNGNADDADDAD